MMVVGVLIILPMRIWQLAGRKHSSNRLMVILGTEHLLHGGCATWLSFVSNLLNWAIHYQRACWLKSVFPNFVFMSTVTTCSLSTSSKSVTPKQEQQEMMMVIQSTLTVYLPIRCS